MSKLPKELLKDYVRTQNFTSTEEVLTAMKEMFKNVVQEVLEAEMDDHLGYDRYDVSEKKVANSRNGFSKKTIKSELGDTHTTVFSSSEGRFVASEKELLEMAKAGQIATGYVDCSGNVTEDVRFNPSGSVGGVEGITSPDGRILGKMTHSERKGKYVGINVPGNKDQLIFESGVAYFK